MVATVRVFRSRKKRRMARARAEPSAGSVLVPNSSRSTRLFLVAPLMIRTTLPICQLKLERVCSMLCSSPISAKTPSKSGSWLSFEAGMGMPACAIRLSRPMVFSVTVLPPVLGPVMTRMEKSCPISRENGTAFSPSNGCLALTSFR